jgi:benzoate 4-monooxygenase
MDLAIPRTSSRALDSILLAIILLSAYYFGIIIYNVFFHPLRSIPGPPLAKVSKAWSRYGNLKGHKSHRIHAAHQRYGSVVRVAPNELSFSSPDAVRDIYTSDAFVKEETFYRAKRVFHEEMLMSFRNAEAHKQRKKLLQRGFSQAAMVTFEPNIDTKIEALLNHWSRKGKEQGGTVDVYPWLLWLAFDIVCTLFNRRWACRQIMFANDAIDRPSHVR